VGIIAPPVMAATPSYPSWGDVQQAKQNVASQQAMVDQITQLINGLQTSLQAAQTNAEKAGEAYLEAKSALADATTKYNALTNQVAAAQAKAKTSEMRAGLLASHLARTSGMNLSVSLLLNSKNSVDADKLLYELGTMSNLTEQSQNIYAQAVSDKNEVQSLTQQANAAKDQRETLAEAAQTALAQAQAAQTNAQNALAAQQQKSTELVSQLASLKNTSAAVEAGYIQGQQAAAAAAAAARAAAAAAAAAQAAHSSSGGGGGGGGNVTTAPPNASAVQIAIAFAESQLGKPYVLDGAGPNVWDCSGLTMVAYAHAGINIGSHSVNNQWYTAAARGQIVPYYDRQPGDLIFWGGGPGSFYHVAIYIGNNQIVAAPAPGEYVKIQAVWGSPYSYVARPTA
jgi:peptidoglycan DL-endopeptidase CwlO